MSTTIFNRTDITNLAASLKDHTQLAYLHMDFASKSDGAVYAKSPGVRQQVQTLSACMRRDARELTRLAKSLESVFS